MLQRLIVLCRQRGAEAIYCLGNLTTGRGTSSKAILKALRKDYLTGILGSGGLEQRPRPKTAQSSRF